MIVRFLGVAVLLAMATAAHAAAPDNPILQYTMKAIGDDVTTVGVPTVPQDPSDVIDGQILSAIARCRTASFQLQLVIDRREGEMLPAVLVGLPQADREAKLANFSDLLTQAIAKLGAAETELQGELTKLPENRDFTALKTTLTALGQIETQAHAIFNPAGPTHH